MDYYGEFIYRDGTLDRVLTSEGYYDPTGADYHYHLKDHLGNTRMTIHYDGSSATAQVDQEIEYYPFGKMFSANNTAENKYLYNGKELQNEFFENYDYGARFYDPELARWHSVDPMAESYYSHSPYHFSGNNPIKFVDLNGMNYDEWDLTVRADGTQDLKWVSDKGGNQTQYVNTKWETGSGETWDLGTETWNNWPNSKAGMMDIMSGGEAALGSWNPKWWDKASGRIDYSPFDPIDLVTGAVAAKWAVSGTKIAATEGTQSFKSFSAFKKAMGSAGSGKHWHHIIEQHADNVAMFGQEAIQNTDNIIKIPGGFKGALHSQVTGHYNSLMPGTNMLVRDYVKTLPYNQQYQYGIDVLKSFGWTP
ncbi:protein containing RHS repeat-associated core domain [Bacteroidales bacterium 6E]|nr:protein containing RHS repeat-associated core domain [Bacteroidales bacterium 6E]